VSGLRVVSRLRVVYAALVGVFLCMVQPFGATAVEGLGQDQRRERQDQNKQCRDSPEFHLLFPSHGAALDAGLFRAWGGNAPQEVEAFQLPLGWSANLRQRARMLFST
jgi:hypothetical protein